MELSISLMGNMAHLTALEEKDGITLQRGRCLEITNFSAGNR